MRVPLLDLKRSLNAEAPALREAFERVLTSGHYVNGVEVEHFEREIAAFCEVTQAVGVSSGTDALLLALMASGIGAGDDVICPTYSFFATAGSIWRTGARPVFVDICPGCFNVLPQAVARALGPRTRAVVPVHLYGQCAQMELLQAAVGKSGAVVIEDAAQAMGARADVGDTRRQAGAMGRAGCFSFFPSKNLGALGDGGLVTTQDAEFADRLRILRNHGAAPKYHHAHVGGNFRLDALQAAFLRVKLPNLHAATRARQNNAARYDKLFHESGRAVDGVCICEAETSAPVPPRAPITLPPVVQSEHTYNQYVIMLDSHGRREHVRQRLLQQQIGCEIYYPVPLHRQGCFSDMAQSTAAFPNAEAAAARSLALPVFPGLAADEIEYVAESVLRACDEAPTA